MKTAIIAGATGLVGGHLLEQVLEDPYFDVIIIFVRRTTGIDHPKLTEHIVNFDTPDEWKDRVKGDILFSAMGTTLKQAGSKEAQKKVDYTYQYEVAKMAAAKGVQDYVLVSTPGASPGSMVFYIRIRGEL
ncbi:MAG: NAD(P)H-binding protein, partial [Bacteroidales bacterium]